MQKINDIRTNLEEELDYSKDINLDTKVSKKDEKNSLDLIIGLKNLNLRKKAHIKLSKLKNNIFDSVFSGPSQKDIDLNRVKKINPLEKSLRKMQVILKDSSSSKKTLQTNTKKEKKHTFIKQHIKSRETQIEKALPFWKDYKKVALSVIAVLFLGLLDKVLLEINLKSAYTNLISVRDNFKDSKKLKENIKFAGKNFFFSDLFYAPISIIPNKKVEDVGHLIAGGKNLQKLMKEGFFLYENINFLVSKNKLEEINFIGFLEKIRNKSENIHTLTYNTLVEYEQVGDLGNTELNEKFKKAKKYLKSLLIFTDKVNKNYDELLSLLAKDRERKYLIVFQNNDEIRPTGGFMGSFATVYLEDGKIKKIDKKDVYAYEWIINKFYKKKERAPEGLNKITRTFGLRDANYFPEFRDSAEKIKFFFDKMAYKVDGVIFINQNIIRDLIDTIDYVDSDSLGERITSKNFSEVVSTLVEAEVGKNGTIGTPKQVLFDFSGEFYAKILGEKKYSKYLGAILRNISSRDIAFYSFHPKENSLLWKFGLSGNINFSETLDFNYPVYTSVGGNKSDRYINYEYEKIITPIPDTCDYNVRLEIYNTSNFSVENKNHIEKILSNYDQSELGKRKKDILNIQGQGENKSYLRILIPKNTEAGIKKGQKLTEGNKYNTLEFYTSTVSGGKSTYSIVYNIKNPECKPYSYKFIKQPGIKKYDITFIDSGETKMYENIETDFIYKKD